MSAAWLHVIGLSQFHNQTVYRVVMGMPPVQCPHHVIASWIGNVNLSGAAIRRVSDFSERSLSMIMIRCINQRCHRGHVLSLKLGGASSRERMRGMSSGAVIPILFLFADQKMSREKPFAGKAEARDARRRRSDENVDSALAPHKSHQYTYEVSSSHKIAGMARNMRTISFVRRTRNHTLARLCSCHYCWGTLSRFHHSFPPSSALGAPSNSGQ
nr:hypothetical protein CFP56_09968 [Quercus suber]